MLRRPGGGSGNGGSGSGSGSGGLGSGPGTSKLVCSLFGQADSQFRGSVASGNPFTDSHAVYTLSDVSVNDPDQVEMSTYHAENTDGWL